MPGYAQSDIKLHFQLHFNNVLSFKVGFFHVVWDPEKL